MQPEAAAPARTGPILVVDDDPRVRELLRLALEDGGFAVSTAADGRRAIEVATGEPPALLVLDLTLPRADGFAVAEAVRRAHGDAVPILVVTADGSPAEKAARVGAVGYLRKPFDVEDLLAAVTRTIGPAA